MKLEYEEWFSRFSQQFIWGDSEKYSREKEIEHYRFKQCDCCGTLNWKRNSTCFLCKTDIKAIEDHDFNYCFENKIYDDEFLLFKYVAEKAVSYMNNKIENNPDDHINQLRKSYIEYFKEFIDQCKEKSEIVKEQYLKFDFTDMDLIVACEKQYKNYLDVRDKRYGKSNAGRCNICGYWTVVPERDFLYDGKTKKSTCILCGSDIDIHMNYERHYGSDSLDKETREMNLYIENITSNNKNYFYADNINNAVGYITEMLNDYIHVNHYPYLSDYIAHRRIYKKLLPIYINFQSKYAELADIENEEIKYLQYKKEKEEKVVTENIIEGVSTINETENKEEQQIYYKCYTCGSLNKTSLFKNDYTCTLCNTSNSPRNIIYDGINEYIKEEDFEIRYDYLKTIMKNSIDYMENKNTRDINSKIKNPNLFRKREKYIQKFKLRYKLYDNQYQLEKQDLLIKQEKEQIENERREHLQERKQKAKERLLKLNDNHMPYDYRQEYQELFNVSNKEGKHIFTGKFLKCPVCNSKIPTFYDTFKYECMVCGESVQRSELDLKLLYDYDDVESYEYDDAFSYYKLKMENSLPVMQDKLTMLENTGIYNTDLEQCKIYNRLKERIPIIEKYIPIYEDKIIKIHEKLYKPSYNEELIYHTVLTHQSPDNIYPTVGMLVVSVIMCFTSITGLFAVMAFWICFGIYYLYHEADYNSNAFAARDFKNKRDRWNKLAYDPRSPKVLIYESLINPQNIEGTYQYDMLHLMDNNESILIGNYQIHKINNDYIIHRKIIDDCAKLHEECSDLARKLTIQEFLSPLSVLLKINLQMLDDLKIEAIESFKYIYQLFKQNLISDNEYNEIFLVFSGIFKDNVVSYKEFRMLLKQRIDKADAKIEQLWRKYELYDTDIFNRLKNDNNSKYNKSGVLRNGMERDFKLSKEIYKSRNDILNADSIVDLIRLEEKFNNIISNAPNQLTKRIVALKCNLSDSVLKELVQIEID